MIDKGPSDVAGRLEMLRRLMSERGVQAYLVPGTDEHQNESPPDTFQRRRWISGFGGSAGTALITLDEAYLFTDGRYLLQASRELDPDLYKVVPTGLPGQREIDQWLAEELPKGVVVAVDPRLITVEAARRLQGSLSQRGKQLRFVEENLIDTLWEGRPSLEGKEIRLHPERFSGEPVSSKLSRIREKIQEFEADCLVLSKLDEIAWLFNLRGGDVSYTPVFIAYALVGTDEALIFTDLSRVSTDLRAALEGLVDFRRYDQIGDALSSLAAEGRKVWMDPGQASQWIYERLRSGSVLENESPVASAKAIKNPVEMMGIRSCHIRDGVAMVRFLKWLENTVPRGGVSELSAARRLAEFRAEMEYFQGPSFETIVAYKDHAAIIHYAPSEETDIPIRPDGLLLVDSGGQYLDGTTDVTRTLCLGEPSAEERDRFTRVLQGHIRVARARFPAATSGKALDVLARGALWEESLDYRHGTGHGVGHFLNVHEGPQSLSPRDLGIALEPGMVLTNEPGYYEDGAYGIRIEGVMLVVEDEQGKGSDYGPFYRFEMLTMVPIDLDLVEPSILSDEERQWLNAYHEEVFARLSPHLAAPEKEWLRHATRPL